MNLNFPKYALQIKTEKGKNYVFDPIRKKYIVLNPEEWVRQHLIQHLLELGYPAGRMSVERSLPQDNKRYDLLIFSNLGEPQVLVECKAPSVPISEETIRQLHTYLMQQAAPYCILTNGLTHYFFERSDSEIINYQQIPHFTTLSR